MAVLLALGALLVLLAGCSSAAANPSGAAGQSTPPGQAPANAPQVVRAPAAQPYTGGPRLAVEEASVDYGKVKLGTTVQTVLHLKNVGDAPLTLTGEPLVQVVQGC